MKLPDLTGINIIEACEHKSLLNIPLSLGQRMFLKAADGLELVQEELDLYCEATGHTSYAAGHFVRNPGLLAGRRFGKTHHIAIPQACYAACFRKYENMRPGERPTVLFLAVTIDQADIDLRAILEVLRNSVTLRGLMPMFTRRGKLSLKNGADIVVQKCDLRSVRGLPVCFCCAEELNFWRSLEDPTVNPAEEVLAAIRPALLQFPYGRLLMVSSAWAMSGPLMSAYAKRLETRDPLVMKMSTQMGNPTISPELLKLELDRDPERYSREILANPADAATALLPSEQLNACVAKGRWENPPKAGVTYIAGLDAAFRSDAFGFSLSHAEGDKVIVDLVRSWQPKPGKAVQFVTVMEAIVDIMKHYGSNRAFADQVANEVIKQHLATAGITLEQVSTLGRRASGIYSTLRAKTLAGQVEFLDNAELLSQLRRLEIVRTSGGGERCEASSGHDDVAIACALSIHQCVSQGATFEPWIENFQGIAPSGPALGRDDRRETTRDEDGFSWSTI